MIEYINKHLAYYAQIASFIAFLYVLYSPVNISGYGLYFLVPLSYCLMSFSCKEVFAYHKGGYGLKCFLGISFIKYVILPCYICYNNGKGFSHLCSDDAYLYAILISSIEICVSMLVIKVFYPKSLRKQSRIMQQRKSYYSDLSIGGLIFLLLLGLLVFVRGHMGDVLNGIRFLVVVSKFDMNADLWTYEIWSVQLILAFFSIVITSYYQKKEDKCPSWKNIIFPLIMVFISCSLILTNNRMTTIYYALSGLCILNYAFPKREKTMTTVIVGAMLLVIITFTLIKNYSIDVSSGSSSTVSSSQTASDLDEYMCGISSVAHSYELYLVNGHRFSLDNIIAEILRFAMPMRLPGLVPKAYANYPTTIDLATTGTEMVSVAGETLFWGGFMFGWLFDIIAVYFIVRILIHYDIRTKLSKDLGKKYIYSWMSILFGIFMCYAIQTLWNNATYIPLYLTFVLWINRQFSIRRTQIKTILHQ